MPIILKNGTIPNRNLHHYFTHSNCLTNCAINFCDQRKAASSGTDNERGSVTAVTHIDIQWSHGVGMFNTKLKLGDNISRPLNGERRYEAAWCMLSRMTGSWPIMQISNYHGIQKELHGLLKADLNGPVRWLFYANNLSVVFAPSRNLITELYFVWTATLSIRFLNSFQIFKQLFKW